MAGEEKGIDSEKGLVIVTVKRSKLHVIMSANAGGFCASSSTSGLAQVQFQFPSTSSWVYAGFDTSHEMNRTIM